MTVTVFEPGFIAIAPEAAPLDTDTPLTVMLAVETAAVGVTVSAEVPAEMAAVYELVAELNVGLRAPLDSDRPARLLLLDAARVTVAVYVFVVARSCAVTIVVMVLIRR